MIPTKDEVLAMYAALLEHAKGHKDSDSNENDPAECVKHAFNGVRSNVHFAMQEASPPPEPHADDDGDPEMHHMRQKSHFKKLWQMSDALIAASGLTEKGLVS